MMKKTAMLISMLLLLVAYLPLTLAFENHPAPPPPVDGEISGVSLTGMVTTYNSEPAYGWLKVYAQIGEWARAYAFVVPGISFEEEVWHHEWEGNFSYSFIFIELLNASTVELNYTGIYDLYIAGLWSAYNITISYVTCENFNITVTPVFEETQGELAVVNGWSEFTLKINGVSVGGIVHHYFFYSVKVLRCDFNSDGKVNVLDLIAVAQSHGKTPGFIGYNFECDINHDFQIDVYDLLEVCMEFEE